jgi:two-component system NtrC family sensor kinase
MHCCTADTRSRASAPGGHDLERDAGGGDDHVQRLAMIGELAASILHQVNGPLTYLLFNLDILERAFTGPASREALRGAREGADLIRELSRDVTLLARTSSQRLAAVDVRSVVRSALRITGARVHSVASVVEELSASPRVRGDATLLLQVLVNGLLNAADACEASVGRGHVVRISVGTDHCGNARISIADDGAGLRPDRVARVFERFFTTKEAGKGTGLGLAVAKRIVERAGGTIAFDSSEGVGSVLHILLPAMGDDE